jgi:mitogen-activated protein kinase 15
MPVTHPHPHAAHAPLSFCLDGLLPSHLRLRLLHALLRLLLFHSFAAPSSPLLRRTLSHVSPQVLLYDDCRLQLCDFGLVRTVPTPAASSLTTPLASAASASASAASTSAASASAANGAVSNSIGSRWYRAPELLLGAREYGTSCDMWSLGCVLAELFSGKTLLLGSSTASQLLKCCQIAGGAPDAETLRAMRCDGSSARTLMSQLPTPIDACRLGKLMLRAPSEVIDLCASLLRLRPAERSDAAACLSHPYMAPFASALPSRHAFASASVRAVPADQLYAPPLDDQTRLDAASYRRYAETHLAEKLDEPQLTYAPSAAGAADEDDMGA